MGAPKAQVPKFVNVPSANLKADPSMLPHFSVRRLSLPAKLRQGVRRLFGALPGARARSLESERQIVETSFLFDRNWYLQKYADVAQAGVDPIHHYMSIGWHEGRDPGPAFTTSAYLKANEDVARAGANPLLHFIQFGLAEGREGFGDRHLPPSANWHAGDFADPHECLSIPRLVRRPLVWGRSYRLDRGDPRFVAVGGTGAGYAPDDSARATLELAIAWLRRLSGDRTDDPPGQDWLGSESGHRLIDAWYVNAAQLRTRWAGGEFPLVLRAFQSSPWAPEVRLVGEGAIASPIDVVDVLLLNPYFPIVFVLASPDGFLRGTVLLTFPSLCRGGTHYPELLWWTDDSECASVDVLAASDALTRKLVPLLRHDAEAAVGRIQVDKAGSDGNGPLFRTDFGAWLAQILEVKVCADGVADPIWALPDRLQRSEAATWRGSGAELVIPSDAAPTIAALVEHRSGGGEQRSAGPAPLLSSRLDPSAPVMSIEVPYASALNPDDGLDRLPWLIPGPSRLAPNRFPAAAIRMSNGQEFSDAQLLVPISGMAFHRQGTRSALTWLLQPEDWQDDRLVEGLQCLALQRGSHADALALTGPTASATLALARNYFPGAVFAVDSLANALRDLRTPVVATVGAGVLLHDPRTADCFSSILANDLVWTASCVVVAAQKRAGVVKTVVVDGGAFVRADGLPADPAECAGAAAELWGGTWPVLRPSAYLWAARSKQMMSGLEEGGIQIDGQAVHMCTSAVTATHLSSGELKVKIPNVPFAPETGARVDWLVG